MREDVKEKAGKIKNRRGDLVEIWTNIDGVNSAYYVLFQRSVPNTHRVSTLLSKNCTTKII